jgi:hypothetical protein
MRGLLGVFLLQWALAGFWADQAFAFGRPGPRPIPDPVFGVTIDSVAGLPEIVDSLRSLPRTPTTRIVFDSGVPASYYGEAVRAIRPVSYVLGQFLDSSAMKDISVRGFRDRVDEYLRLLGREVDLWEVGNEVNGSWLGDAPSVVAKIRYAFDRVRQRNGRTALTLYYSCDEGDEFEMFGWTERNIPEAVRLGVDYALVSYYEAVDCETPDFEAMFARLAKLFPRAKLGFGECGTEVPEHKAELLRQFYGMSIPETRYVGGYFWWYFHQDMVPRTLPLWQTLNDAVLAWH